MQVIERFVRAKSGNESKCEDRIVVGEHFAAVIDGTTAKTRVRYDGLTPGQLAATLLGDAILTLSPSSSFSHTLKSLTDCLRYYYRRHGLLRQVREAPHERAAATVAIFSKFRREVWLVGECKALIGRVSYSNEKDVDRIWASARAIILEAALARRATVDQLRRNDLGRNFIRPGLVVQGRLQNAGARYQYGYAAIDGFPVKAHRFEIIRVPHGVNQIVLATDGYPELRRTLYQTEVGLRNVLRRDPLCFRLHQATKGVGFGEESFDDRAYLRLRL